MKEHRIIATPEGHDLELPSGNTIDYALSRPESWQALAKSIPWGFHWNHWSEYRAQERN